MPVFETKTVSETPYLYVEKSCSMDPTDISRAMGEAFGQVWQFVEDEGIKSACAALSVYYDYDPSKMNFRAGFTISQEDMSKADGIVQADVTPAGEVLYFQHEGPYSTLRDDYGLMMKHIADVGREVATPTWEIYLNEPSQVPEHELLTDVFAALK